MAEYGCRMVYAGVPSFFSLTSGDGKVETGVYCTWMTNGIDQGLVEENFTLSWWPCLVLMKKFGLFIPWWLENGVVVEAVFVFGVCLRGL